MAVDRFEIEFETVAVAGGFGVRALGVAIAGIANDAATQSDVLIAELDEICDVVWRPARRREPVREHPGAQHRDQQCGQRIPAAAESEKQRERDNHNRPRHIHV